METSRQPPKNGQAAVVIRQPNPLAPFGGEAG